MYIKNEKLYHALKYIAQVILPALATLVATLGEIWDCPYSKEISATVMAIDTFLGVALHVSKLNYYEISGLDDGGDSNDNR